MGKVVILNSDVNCLNLQEMEEKRGPVSGSPVEGKKRHIILDALRGFAILGICLANYPEFSLYTFLQPMAVESMPSHGIDLLTKYLIYIFIDGKFYTIFSLLFGIGFSIILENNYKRGANGQLIFYRRMFYLLLIGFLHLMLIWSGDILMLYAAVGLLLPLFRKAKDRTILIWATVFLVMPVIVDYICEWTGIYLSRKLVEWQGLYCDRYGITTDNFAYWLRDARTYGDVFKFLIQGSIERMSEFVDGNRYFKVAGLFLIGYIIGRNKMFARLEAYKKPLRVVMGIGLMIGLPLSWLYAWSAISGKPWGLGAHSVLYLGSVYITSFGYISTLCYLYLKRSGAIVWKVLAYPGRMALTNYILQSVLGMIIFYGIGFGLGADTGLFSTEWIAAGVYLFEVCLSWCWLQVFRFGPLEWVWRCLTYKRFYNPLAA